MPRNTLFVLVLLMLSGCGGDVGACAFFGGVPGSLDRGICYEDWEKKDCDHQNAVESTPYAYFSGKACNDLSFTKKCSGEYFFVRSNDWCP